VLGSNAFFHTKARNYGLLFPKSKGVTMAQKAKNKQRKKIIQKSVKDFMICPLKPKAKY